MTQTIRPRNLSVGEYLLAQFREAPRELAFDARGSRDFGAWKEEFGARLRECLGPFPEPCELDPEVIETVDEGPYLREKVLFNSEPDMAVVAYVLVPKGMETGERRPAILACHGHGHGKDDICGIDHGEQRRVSTIADLNYDYARQFAERGYVVIAPDWRGFGERRLGGERSGQDSCDLLFIKGMLFGQNLLTLNIWDAMCSLSYLQSRPDVDPERVGVAGLSYGGTMALFTAALDERVRCAVVSGYLNSLGSFALGYGNFCGAQVPTGLLGYGDLSDVGCLVAPRPLLIESGTQDNGFPLESSRDAAAAVRRGYEAASFEERFGVDEFVGGHRWSGARAYEWMDRWL